jgi:hypothetical protein
MVKQEKFCLRKAAPNTGWQSNRLWRGYECFSGQASALIIEGVLPEPGGS